MSRTLLDIVQGILSTLDSDTVNSISDTVEADQVADIVKQCYFDIVDEYQLPGNRVITNLEGVSDVNRPNMLKIPDDTQSLIHWQYDGRILNSDPLNYLPVEYRPPDLFLEEVNRRDSLETTKYIVVYVQPNVPIITDFTTHPQRWTSFDDKYIVTDNFCLDVDASLQASKTQAWVEKRHIFEKTDEYIPTLPDNLQSILYRTAENMAYALNKQVVNPKLEQKEARLRIRTQRNKHRSQQTENNFMNGVNYGRK
jgi:hypothetical protein